MTAKRVLDGAGPGGALRWLVRCARLPLARYPSIAVWPPRRPPREGGGL